MAKMALLIGVSEYLPDFNPLPLAAKDVEAIQRVLLHRDLGNFDNVQLLINPDQSAMREAIETLFSYRQRNDLVLLFFSGHGIKDSSGNLHFANKLTRKKHTGELFESTAVPATFVHRMMNSSRSRHKVIVLDCCFSGAFAENLSAKDDGSIDIKEQLGGEGAAILTSSTSTQYSFVLDGTDLSIYTYYFVEGIKTGAADLNKDGIISVDELHDYAKHKVQKAVPEMKPEIYTMKEGFKISLAKAGPVSDPGIIDPDILRFIRLVALWSLRLVSSLLMHLPTVVLVVIVSVFIGASLRAIHEEIKKNDPFTELSPLLDNGKNKPKPNITRAEYNAVRPGMTYNEVVQIIGSPGEEDGSDLSGSNTFTTYIWRNNSWHGEVRMTFKNNTLWSKGPW